MWAFNTNIFEALEDQFKTFLDTEAIKDPKKSEYFIPSVVSSLLANNKIKVKVMESKDKWFGVTYKEDKQAVVDAIKGLIDAGVYKEKLFD